LLNNKDNNVRGSAAYALGELEEVELYVAKQLVGLLEDKDEDVRKQAADTLGKLGLVDPVIAKGLLNLLNDKNAYVRGSAALALGRLGEVKPDIVEQLLNLLGDKNAYVRGSAADTLDPFLGEPMPISSQHLPTLKHFLNNDNWLEYRFGWRTKVKDVAWRLLQHYSEETGEHIYKDNEEDQNEH
jgi:HEAT repeat protein